MLAVLEEKSAIGGERPMNVIRALLVTSALLAAPLPAQAAEDEWPAFGHALTLIHAFVRIAAESETPQQSAKAIDDVLLGRNAAVNEAAAGLFNEMTAGMPREHRATMAAIGRDLASLAKKDLGNSRPEDASSATTSLQARKDLTSMGLTYHDSKQFL